MTPAIYSKFAERAFPFRWWLGTTSVVGVALVMLLAAQGGAHGFRLAAVVAGPLIGLPWTALCAAVWFHPVRGYMRPASRIMGSMPAALQSATRWYAAVFLGMFVLVSAVVWPLFALSVL